MRRLDEIKFRLITYFYHPAQSFPIPYNESETIVAVKS